MITCIIPAFNEGRRIKAVVTRVLAAKKEGLVDEVIVVSDGSTDTTAKAAKEAGADQIIAYSPNKGKACAVMTGIRAAKPGDILLLDADLTTLQVSHIRQLVKAAEASESLMVIGFLSDDLGQQVVPHLSGQRVIKRELAARMLEEKWDKGRANFEILANRLAAKLKSSTVMIPLAELHHVRKEHKYSNYEAFYRKMLFPVEVAKVYKALLWWLALAAVVAYVSSVVAFPLWPHNDHLASFPALTSSDRILVIAAHPDDESIGASGLMYDAAQKGAHVAVAVVSLGDANKFSAGVMGKTPLPSNQDYIDEGNARLKESQAALGGIGVTDSYFLGFPDRYLKDVITAHWDSPLTSKYSGWNTDQYPGTYKPGSSYTGSELLAQLKSIIAAERPTIVITHMEEDTNSDHQTVAKMAKLAVSELASREVVSKPGVYGFLVHWSISEYPSPFRKATNFPLNPPEDLQNKCAWVSYPLTKATQEEKEKVLAKYVTQLKSPFLKGLIEATDRTNELYCPAGG